MSTGLNVLGVIPARGGSKGIPKKNIYPLCGRPLIAYVIDAAKRAALLDHFIVSTENKEIADAARQCGADVPFLRPEQYANDTISVTVAGKHALEFFDAQGIRYDAVLSLQPTSPLTLAEDIDACIRKMAETDCDSVVSMKFLEEAHPWRIYNMQEDKVVPFNEYTKENFPQRQDRPPAYKMSGAVFLRKRRLLEQWNGVDFALGQDKRGILIPGDRSVDVNCPEDLLVAESLLKKLEKTRGGL